MGRLSGRRLARVLLQLAAIAAVVAVAVLGVRRVDLPQVAAALRRANPWLLGTAVPALLALNYALRSARFHVLVRALKSPALPFRLWDSAKSLISSQAANNLVPLRLGELVRTRDLVGRGYDLKQVVVAQVTEKGVEALTLIACAIPLVPAGIVRLPPLPGGRWTIAAGALVIAMAALIAWRARRGSERLAGLLVLGPRTVARCTCWSLSADLAELVLIAVTLASLGLAPEWRSCLAVYVGINLAIAIPSTPAQLGAFEAGGALALTFFGTGAELAVAFALLYRVVQWLPVTAVGAVIWLMPKRPLANSLPAGE